MINAPTSCTSTMFRPLLLHYSNDTKHLINIPCNIPGYLVVNEIVSHIDSHDNVARKIWYKPSFDPPWLSRDLSSPSYVTKEIRSLSCRWSRQVMTFLSSRIGSRDSQLQNIYSSKNGTKKPTTSFQRLTSIRHFETWHGHCLLLKYAWTSISLCR